MRRAMFGLGGVLSLLAGGLIVSSRVDAAVSVDLAVDRVEVSQAGAGKLAVTVEVVRRNDAAVSGAATLTVHLPTGVTFASGADCTAVGTDVRCLIGPATEAVRLDHYLGGAFTVAVDPAVTSPGTITGEVVGVDPDPEPSNNALSAVLPAPVGFDLAVTGATARQVAASLYEVAVDVQQITTTNTEPPISAPATLTVQLPAGVTFASSSTCTASGSTVVCAIGPATEAVRLRYYLGGLFRVAVDPTVTTIPPLQFTIAGADPDPVSANNTFSLQLGPVNGLDLAVTELGLRSSTSTSPITANAQLPATGGPLTLTFVPQSPNVTTTLWVTPQVVIDLPPELSFVSGTGCTAAGNRVTCSVGPEHEAVRLEALISPTVTVQLRGGTNGLTAPITASISSSVADPVAANDRTTLDLGPVVPRTPAPADELPVTA